MNASLKSDRACDATLGPSLSRPVTLGPGLRPDLSVEDFQAGKPLNLPPPRMPYIQARGHVSDDQLTLGL